MVPSSTRWYGSTDKTGEVKANQTSVIRRSGGIGFVQVLRPVRWHPNATAFPEQVQYTIFSREPTGASR